MWENKCHIMRYIHDVFAVHTSYMFAISETISYQSNDDTDAETPSGRDMAGGRLPADREGKF